MSWEVNGFQESGRSDDDVGINNQVGSCHFDHS